MVVSHGAGPLDVRKARRIQSVANSAERKIAVKRATLKTRHVLNRCTIREKKARPSGRTPEPNPYQESGEENNNRLRGGRQG